MQLGIPELFIILILSGFWLVLIGAAIWALITLHRVRVGQDALRARLDAIERLLPRA